jgi:CubicO group peptidase (beta-lactamase class C family)
LQIAAVNDQKIMRRTSTALRLSLAAAGIGFALSGCGNLSATIVTKPNDLDWADMNKTALPDLVETMARPFIENGTNIGLVVGVLDGEKQDVFGFGKTSLESGKTPDGDTIFAIGSVTKAFLSLAVYQLVQDGALKLSDNLGELFPPNIPLSEAAKKITVGQLLTHSSGLPRQPNDLPMLISTINYLFTGENIYRHIDAEKVFEFLKDFDPDSDEVGAYRYSNIGSGILARAIEYKTGEPLEALLDRGILRRIGAKDTTFRLTPEQASRLATGHVGDSPLFVPRNTPVAQWDMGDILSGGAALYSTANDLLGLARYRISMGSADRESTPINTGLFSVSSQSEQKSSYGWDLEDFPQDKADFPKEKAEIVFQHGMISGYSAYVGVEIDKKIGVVVLANNFNWNDYIGHSLLLALTERASTAPNAP